MEKVMESHGILTGHKCMNFNPVVYIRYLFIYYIIEKGTKARALFTLQCKLKSDEKRAGISSLFVH